MCGIAGYFSPRPIEAPQAAMVEAMVGAMVHRGPDSSGMFQAEHLAMGMRRLSIVDLAGGDQPIYNEDRSVVLVCNGEIYNHAQLRADLSAKGHVFQTRGDVETIVHLYEEHGAACVDHLRGMFAFALWDAPRQKLLLARDRMGEKPLLLYHDPAGGLWFASELRSLLKALGGRTPTLSPRALNLFMTFQYVPEPETPVEEFRLLPAGHLLTASAGEGVAEPRSYWEYTGERQTAGDPVEVVRRSLDQACLLMGTADVPVGVALSGGIDSSLVAALTAKHFPGVVHTFTVGYPGQHKTDERDIASRFSQSIGLPYSEVMISGQEVVESFPELMRAMDMPVGDIAAYGYYSVARAAREAQVPVLLSGLGGDELFWGYDWVRQAARDLFAHGKGEGFWSRLRRLGKPRQAPSFFGVHEELRQGDQLSRLLMTPKALDQVPEGLWLDLTPYTGQARPDMEVLALLNRTWLRSNCLTLADRVSMAHSVEMRLPLLDVELTNAVTGLRNAGLQDWNLPHKALLIEAIGGIIPDEILHRKKQGFTPPTLEWMTGINARYQALLPQGSLVQRGLLQPDRLQESLANLPPSFLYKLLCMEVWARLVLDGQSGLDMFAADGGAE